MNQTNLDRITMKKLRHLAIRAIIQKGTLKSAKIAHKIAWLIEAREVLPKDAFACARVDRGTARPHYYKYLMIKRMIARGIPLEEFGPVHEKRSFIEIAVNRGEA